MPAKGHSHPALRTSSSTHVPSVYAFHTMAVPVKTVSLSPFIDSPLVVRLQEGYRDIFHGSVNALLSLPNVYTFIVTFY